MFSYNLWVIQKEKEKEEINKLKELVKINRMQKSIHIAKVDLSDTNEYMDTYLERLKQNKIINSRPLNHSHNNSIILPIIWSCNIMITYCIYSNNNYSI